MRVVVRDEPLDLLSSDGCICEVGPLEALAADDRKPDLDKTQPRRMYWEEMEHKRPVRMGVQPIGHFGGPMRADGVEDEMDGLADRGVLVEHGQQLAELPRAMLEPDHSIYLAIVDPEAGQEGI